MTTTRAKSPRLSPAPPPAWLVATATAAYYVSIWTWPVLVATALVALAVVGAGL